MSKYHKLLVLIIVLVAYASWLAVGGAKYVFSGPKAELRQGLDLAGGVRVVLEAEDGYKKDLSAEKMNAAKKVIARRVDKLGVTEPKVQVQGQDRIIIELPGLKDKKKALEEIQRTDRLEFYWMRDLTTRRNPMGQWEMLDPDTDADGNEVYSFRNRASQEVIKGDTPENKELILYKVANARHDVKNPDGREPILTGDHLKPNARATLNQGQPVIMIEFNKEGAKIFREFTRKHVEDILAIFWGGEILTAPRINEAIPTGSAIISGFASLEEANQVAQSLNAGALPIPFKIVQQDVVEATLGQETVNQAKIAGIIGIILVIAFMLLYYRLPGLLANIALVIYALLVFATFKLLNQTITLPGLAGFILSIGMAVDANILIFERLKEELQSGKTLRASIDAGFARAFTAILDSNVCTWITCAVLYMLGTGTVKSFAVTLALGVAFSMFTAITVTRTFLHLMVSIPAVQKPWLFGLSTSWVSRLGWQFNIIGRRNIYLAISGLFIVASIGFYIANFTINGHGLKPGIEFKSGTSIQAQFKKPVTVTEVTKMMADLGVKSEVQISKADGATTAFIRTDLNPTDAADSVKLTEIEDTLKGQIVEGKTQIMSVGPAISSELTYNAILAVILASAAIIIYLSFRFAIGGFLNGLKFGVIAVCALVHDAILMVGLFAATGLLLGWEVDTLFVTAVLTIIGYSVHNTIVIFDRTRENLRHRLRGEDFSALANRSILQTLSRSINTSLTIVFVIVALIAFGGPIIKQFYIALLLGTVVGTYSSVFIANPLLVIWEGVAARRNSGATRRKSVEDRPMVSVERAKELKPMMEATGMVPPSDDSEESIEKVITGDQVKVKPKKKKKRF